MRYERDESLHNFLLQMIVVVAIVGALFMLDHSAYSTSETMTQTQAPKVTLHK